jgi:hypothetical protein
MIVRAAELIRSTAPNPDFQIGLRAPLSINPEPLGYTRGLEPLGPELVAEGLVERQTPGFRPESRRVDFFVSMLIFHFPMVP